MQAMQVHAAPAWGRGRAAAERSVSCPPRRPCCCALQVISHLYELYGEEVAGMLDGFFAFVILDTRNNSCVRIWRGRQGRAVP